MAKRPSSWSRRLSGGKGEPSYKTMAPKKWKQSRSSILTKNNRSRKPK